MNRVLINFAHPARARSKINKSLRWAVRNRLPLFTPQLFIEGVKLDIFQDQVFVFTPRGDVKDMPAGATPLDFAYRIHTEVGHACIGAKVNNRLVPLDYKLKNGDIVEIVTTKSAHGPWRLSASPALYHALPTRYFRDLGLPELAAR